MKKFLLILPLILLIGCVTPKCPQLPVTPVAPVLQTYSRPPIIEIQTNKNVRNYIVSDEFVINALLLKDYNDRITTWKVINSLP